MVGSRKGKICRSPGDVDKPQCESTSARMAATMSLHQSSHQSLHQSSHQTSHQTWHQTWQAHPTQDALTRRLATNKQKASPIPSGTARLLSPGHAVSWREPVRSLVIVHGRWSRVIVHSIIPCALPTLNTRHSMYRGRIARLCGDLAPVERQHSEFPFALTMVVKTPGVHSLKTFPLFRAWLYHTSAFASRPLFRPLRRPSRSQPATSTKAGP